ncbi:hypothetical protein F5Y04DRAFT_167928 [Hypomontagnella monticulosa]|nr:hypothetical protein F5Y04DRAFT_167928 [Hypomontagnella monticulosa]
MSAQPPLLDPSRVGEDKGPMTTTVISIVAAISTLVAIARLWVRVRIMRKFQFDDMIIVVAVVSIIAASLLPF